MQVSYFGLYKAINSFLPAVGENLVAYAQPYVRERSAALWTYLRERITDSWSDTNTEPAPA